MFNLKTLNLILRQVAEEKGLPKEKVLEAVEEALAKAYKKDYAKKTEIIRAKINPETGETQFWQVKLVVDKSMLNEGEEKEEEKKEENEEDKKIKFNPDRHILLEEAQEINPQIKVGEELILPLENKTEFSRIAAQTAKQVILQKLHEFEREFVINEFKDKVGTVVSGVIQRIEGKNVYVDLGKALAIMPLSESIPNEYLKIGERKKFYVLSIEDKPRGPMVLLSRSHPKFVIKLFEMEVPEINEGLVEIKSIAREPGSRTKIAVISHQEEVDPIGSLVGQRGTRVAVVIDELNGEKIDIVEYSEEPAKFVAQALGPAKVDEVEILTDRREVRLFVPPEQLSLAIGKNGQNVRLAAKLTGWRIDVRSSMEPERTVESGVAEAEETEKISSEEPESETEQTETP